MVSVAATLVLPATMAFAGSPLLSGYGGPGAGEQAILGSTLIGGSGGAGGSSGSGDSAGLGSATGSGGVSLSGSTAASTSNTGGTSSTGSGSARGSGAVGSGSGNAASKGVGNPSRSPRTGSMEATTGAAAYVYPTSQGSVVSPSPLTGISSGDVLLLIGILATLGLVAVLTLRLSRLQS
jgi:hypothetical protein